MYLKLYTCISNKLVCLENQSVNFWYLSRPQGMAGMMQTREEKIKSFKEKKELDARVKELHDKMKQDHVDEDVKVTCLLKLDKFCSKNLQKLFDFQLLMVMLFDST